MTTTKHEKTKRTDQPTSGSLDRSGSMGAPHQDVVLGLPESIRFDRRGATPPASADRPARHT